MELPSTPAEPEPTDKPVKVATAPGLLVGVGTLLMGIGALLSGIASLN